MLARTAALVASALWVSLSSFWVAAQQIPQGLSRDCWSWEPSTLVKKYESALRLRVVGQKCDRLVFYSRNTEAHLPGTDTFEFEGNGAVEPLWRLQRVSFDRSFETRERGFAFSLGILRELAPEEAWKRALKEALPASDTPEAVSCVWRKAGSIYTLKWQIARQTDGLVDLHLEVYRYDEGP